MHSNKTYTQFFFFLFLLEKIKLKKYKKYKKINRCPHQYQSFRATSSKKKKKELCTIVTKIKQNNNHSPTCQLALLYVVTKVAN
jgi:hypothetical protein